jgi:hypothetical protein
MIPSTCRLHRSRRLGQESPREPNCADSQLKQVSMHPYQVTMSLSDGRRAGMNRLSVRSRCPSWLKRVPDRPEIQLPLYPRSGLKSGVAPCPKSAISGSRLLLLDHLPKRDRATGTQADPIRGALIICARRRLLLFFAKDVFNCLHHRYFEILFRKAIPFKLVDIVLQTLSLDDLVILLRVVIAAEPGGDYPWGRNFHMDKLVTRNLGNVDCRLRLTGGRGRDDKNET